MTRKVKFIIEDLERIEKLANFDEDDHLKVTVISYRDYNIKDFIDIINEAMPIDFDTVYIDINTELLQKVIPYLNIDPHTIFSLE